MTTRDHEVIDRNGKHVTRANGVVHDGDRVVVKMNMMDAANPALIAAAALADSVRRNEQFDARGHRPGYVTRDAASATSIEKILTDRETALTNAWRQPPSVTVEDSNITPVEKVAVVGPSAGNDALFAARDKVVRDRDRQLEDAWRK
jgi:hypothetical protein